MKANETIENVLNEQQMLMLRLLKTPLPEADFAEIRRLAVKLLSKKLDEVVEKWEEERNIDADFYDQLGNNHFRSSASKTK